MYAPVAFVRTPESYSQSASEFFLGHDQHPAQLLVAVPLPENAAVMRTKLTDRLEILQANDHFRDWRTLDDERVCVLCDRKFTGHEVVISTVGEDFELRCPTPNCKSGVHQWVYPGNPLLSDNSYEDWWHALGSTDGLDGTPSPRPI
jgi:hypothetical protein